MLNNVHHLRKLISTFFFLIQWNTPFLLPKWSVPNVLDRSEKQLRFKDNKVHLGCCSSWTSVNWRNLLKKVPNTAIILIYIYSTIKQSSPLYCNYMKSDKNRGLSWLERKITLKQKWQSIINFYLCLSGPVSLSVSSSVSPHIHIQKYNTLLPYFFGFTNVDSFVLVNQTSFRTQGVHSSVGWLRLFAVTLSKIVHS